MMAVSQCISIQQTFNEFLPCYKSTFYNLVSWNSFSRHHWPANGLVYLVITFMGILLTSACFLIFGVIFFLIVISSLGLSKNSFLIVFPVGLLLLLSRLWKNFLLTPVLMIIKQLYSRVLYYLSYHLNLFPLPKRWYAHTDDCISISLARPLSYTHVFYCCGYLGIPWTNFTERTHHLLFLVSNPLLILKALHKLIVPRTVSTQKPMPRTQEAFHISSCLPCTSSWCELSFISLLQNVSALCSSSTALL